MEIADRSFILLYLLAWAAILVSAAAVPAAVYWLRDYLRKKRR